MENKNPKIYILSGKARAGKDTTAGFLKSEYEKLGKSVIVLQFSSYIKEYAKKISDWDGSEETKPRELLQKLGTDIIRKNLGSDFFVRKLIEDIKVYSYFFDIIIISDCRFKIEIEMPKKEFSNIKAINIIRPNFDNGLTEEQKHHATEVDLDDYDNFYKKIINDGSLEELKNKVIQLIEEVEHES